MSEGSEIVGIAARGDGIASDGRHQPLTAPGDRLRADGGITRGPHHREPPCRHFPECGGCTLQHLDDASYATYLHDRVASALAQHGLSTEIRAPILSPPKTRRRATLHAERRGRQVLLGFTESKSHRLVDVYQCEILHPDLFALLQPLRGLLAAMLPRSRRADIHLTLADQGADILIKGVEADGLANAEALTSFAARHNLARLTIDEGLGPEPRWEPDPVTVTLGGVPVALPPGAFLQATQEGQDALSSAARGICEGAATVADLFAGLGTLSLIHAPKTKVYAAEASRDAVMSLKAAANAAQRPVFTDHRDLYRRPLTVEELNRFDAVILDPPRAGAQEQMRNLADAMPRIAYISCNPSTFSRDAAILCEGGYMLEWVQPVGQFRWSTHVELATSFRRQSSE
ncbi:class I SAM-dependent RNA methyltransferase [Stakelama sediminis]|uniref:23S rRNA (Uracil1939-C5)-methyltransferase n=1 Tax=Stakelama sediminis TaxID=463200 RepID=A0A840YZC9_9SPHN|nr:methyltransferase [Stakelama sediminis]MBB5718899.1 23S rRNA (uracil1939-C5)-methyltransferase [Stakelama sediminis]